MEYKGLSSGICRLSATHRKQGAHWVFGSVQEIEPSGSFGGDSLPVGARFPGFGTVFGTIRQL